MVMLEISNTEKNVLAHVLNFYLSNLRMEIANTDSSFFKVKLKSEKDVLLKILERLENNLEQVS
jgi:hypothetical protein